MKRKIIISLLIIAGLFIITGCENKDNKNTNTKAKKVADSELVYEDTTHNTKTTFKYNKEDFEVTKEEVNLNTNITEIYLQNKKLNIDMRLAYTYYNQSKVYSNMKSSKKELPTFKEYTWNGINGFMYGLGENYMNFIIPLEVNDSNEIILTVLVTPIDDPKTSVLEACKGEVIQDFLNSIEYEK